MECHLLFAKPTSVSWIKTASIGWPWLSYRDYIRGTAKHIYSSGILEQPYCKTVFLKIGWIV